MPECGKWRSLAKMVLEQLDWIRSFKSIGDLRGVVQGRARRARARCMERERARWRPAAEESAISISIQVIRNCVWWTVWCSGPADRSDEDEGRHSWPDAKDIFEAGILADTRTLKVNIQVWALHQRCWRDNVTSRLPDLIEQDRADNPQQHSTSVILQYFRTYSNVPSARLKSKTFSSQMSCKYWNIRRTGFRVLKSDWTKARETTDLRLKHSFWTPFPKHPSISVPAAISLMQAQFSSSQSIPPKIPSLYTSSTQTFPESQSENSFDKTHIQGPSSLPIEKADQVCHRNSNICCCVVADGDCTGSGTWRQGTPRLSCRERIEFWGGALLGDQRSREEQIYSLLRRISSTFRGVVGARKGHAFSWGSRCVGFFALFRAVDCQEHGPT